MTLILKVITKDNVKDKKKNKKISGSFVIFCNFFSYYLYLLYIQLDIMNIPTKIF